MFSTLERTHLLESIFAKYEITEMRAVRGFHIRQLSIDAVFLVRTERDTLDIWRDLITLFPRGVHLSITREKFPDTPGMVVAWSNGRWFL